MVTTTRPPPREGTPRIPAACSGPQGRAAAGGRRFRQGTIGKPCPVRGIQIENAPHRVCVICDLGGSQPGTILLGHRGSHRSRVRYEAQQLRQIEFLRPGRVVHRPRGGLHNDRAEQRRSRD